MFPNSTTVTTNTGFSRSYGVYPYGDYKTNNEKLLFPVSPMDERIPAKERVLAIIDDKKAKVYRFKDFASGSQMIIDEFHGNEILIVGNEDMNFIVAYENNLNGVKQDFELAANTNNNAILFSDTKGNKYDVFGQVIEGPNTGSGLRKMSSFMAYWFSIGAFYPNAIIHESGN
jgi:hypothetical protein